MNKPVHIGLSMSRLLLSWGDFLDDTSTNHPKSIYSEYILGGFGIHFAFFTGFESVPIGLGVVSNLFQTPIPGMRRIWRPMWYLD